MILILKRVARVASINLKWIVFIRFVCDQDYFLLCHLASRDAKIPVLIANLAIAIQDISGFL